MTGKRSSGALQGRRVGAIIAPMNAGLSWPLIGERVKRGRESAGLTQKELAARVGLERSMVTKLESGERHIDAVELSRIAEVLDFPVTHFLTPPPAVVSRRTAVGGSGTAGGGKADRDSYRAEARLTELLRDVRQLVDDGVLDLFRVLRYPHPVPDKESARRAALWLREELRLEADPVESVADACDKAGQFIAVLTLPVDGASLVDGDVAVAVVNDDQEPGRRRSTAAHELGHLVLGDEFTAEQGVHASREQREQVVDAFAAEFLLPGDKAREAVGAVSADEGPRVDREQDKEALRRRVVALSATYRVSWNLALNQLRDTGLLPGGVLHWPRERTPTNAEFKDALGWRPQPDLASMRVPPRFATAVMAAHREYKITRFRALEMMRGQITDDELGEE